MTMSTFENNMYVYYNMKYIHTRKYKSVLRKTTKNHKRKKGGTGSKILLVEKADVDIFNSIIKDTTTFGNGAQTISGFIKDIVPDEISEQIKITIDQPVTKKTDKELLHNITFILYPYMLNVFNEIEKIRTGTSGNKSAKYDTLRKKQQVFALKTIRKIDLVKKPVWLESLISYIRFIMGMGGDSLNSLESMMYSDDLEDIGKQGAKVSMNIFKSYANDRKINNPNCKNDNDFVVNYNIKHYGDDPIRDANHALNSIFYQDVINAKQGYTTNAAKEYPLTTQIDEILVGNVPK
jgi:hypothetical protein